jgi:hypothetical protein
VILPVVGRFFFTFWSEFRAEFWTTFFAILSQFRARFFRIFLSGNGSWPNDGTAHEIEEKTTGKILDFRQTAPDRFRGFFTVFYYNISASAGFAIAKETRERSFRSWRSLQTNTLRSSTDTCWTPTVLTDPVLGSIAVIYCSH